MEHELHKLIVPARGKTGLMHQLNYLLPRVDKIIIALCHQAGQLQGFVQEKYPTAAIEFSKEPGDEPRGTAAALYLAIQKTSSDKILVLNGDDLTNIDIEALKKNTGHTICTANPRLPFGLVHEQNGFASFTEKPILKEHWVSCGWYMFDRASILPLIPETGSLEYDVFPNLKLQRHKHEGFWQTINSLGDIEAFEARKDVPEYIDKE